MSSLNIGILSVFYTMIGAALSYVLNIIFKPYGVDWRSQSLFFKTSEVSIQLAIIGLVAFWTTYIIQISPPVFPVSRRMDRMVDTYISGVFFVYAVFIFFDPLWDKIKNISSVVLGKELSRKTDDNKNRKESTS